MVAISHYGKSPAIACGRSTAFAGSGARLRQCGMAARSSSVLSISACAVGGTVSHATEARHAQLSRRAVSSALAAAWDANSASYRRAATWLQ
jgi:hypothetical protein